MEKNETAENTTQEQVAPEVTQEVNSMETSFMDAFEMPPAEEKPATTEESTPGSEGQEETEKNKETSDTPADETEFDSSLLDIELKRFDKKMTLKEYLKKHPEDVKEVLQKKWDYEERKNELRELKEREMTEINSRKKAIDTVLLRNLGLEIGLEPKTLEDFEADTRIEDPDEAYEKYITEFKNKATPLLENKKLAERDNLEMIDNFSREYKGVDVGEVFEDLKPYLNSAVAMGYIPFPEDALEVFYRGRNYDKLVKAEVEKAVELERKKIYKELSGKPNNLNLNHLHGDKAKNKKEDTSNRSPMEQSFLEAWQ